MESELSRFTQAFSRAIRIEMAEMKKRLGSFEVHLGPGLEILPGENERVYQFDLPVKNEKLLPGIECELRYGGGTALVTVREVSDTAVRVEAREPVPLAARPHVLVVYPWFLYERLSGALDSLSGTEHHFVDTAFRAFGRSEAHIAREPLANCHEELNGSQRHAVSLSLGSNLAFIWGPPGTGKTTTLAHIVDELLETGFRILVTSTTNAAVDQSLAKMVELGFIEHYIEGGMVLRAGSGGGETYGTSMQEIIDRRTGEGKERRRELMERKRLVEERLAAAEALRKQLDDEMTPDQFELFETNRRVPDLSARFVFEGEDAAKYANAAGRNRLDMIDAVREELEQELVCLAEEIDKERLAGASHRGAVARGARLTLATMAAMYVNPVLIEQSYDTVIVEEAGMAVLPAVFYCAALAREKVLFVGDPKQLPPILQSRDPYVRRAMGRSIFDVAVPEPEESPMVALLDTQYRMHPVLGELISSFFYGGRVQNGISACDRDGICGSEPYSGEPLVLVDTAGIGTCGVQDGGFSRYNEDTAALCVSLAATAASAGHNVAVITPYVEQSKRVRRLLTKKNITGVECRTIHRFQGGERDVVVFDTVDSAPLSPGKLLAGDGTTGDAGNLLNVSFSRARGKLIVLADLTYFSSSGSCPLLSDLLAALSKTGHVVRADQRS